MPYKEIAELTKIFENHLAKLTQFKQEYTTYIDKLKENHIKEISNLKELHTKKEDELKSKISSLEEQINSLELLLKKRSKEEHIATLEKAAKFIEHHAHMCKSKDFPMNNNLSILSTSKITSKSNENNGNISIPKKTSIPLSINSTNISTKNSVPNVPSKISGVKRKRTDVLSEIKTSNNNPNANDLCRIAERPKKRQKKMGSDPIILYSNDENCKPVITQAEELDYSGDEYFKMKSDFVDWPSSNSKKSINANIKSYKSKGNYFRSREREPIARNYDNKKGRNSKNGYYKRRDRRYRDFQKHCSSRYPNKLRKTSKKY